MKGVIQQLLTCGIQKQVVASDVRLLSLGKEATDKENRTEQYGLRRCMTMPLGQHSYCQQEFGMQNNHHTVQPGGSSTSPPQQQQQRTTSLNHCSKCTDHQYYCITDH
ncbi:hypothetical protein Pmani_011106 [Petrolisthes manimaculis]|uniref:Uncharacterized protein n=1 Tax=Petrolisthes manimaculis TaxID=1843537 RepID=A0AAE1UBY0_9EUCA|nr:hypothetical protein Pmani_011106 [Petrolisthes manimaculis]